MKNVYALAIVLVQALSFGLTSTASAADPGIFDKKGNVLQDSMASDPTQPNWKMATEADNLDIHGVGWLSGRSSLRFDRRTLCVQDGKRKNSCGRKSERSFCRQKVF